VILRRSPSLTRRRHSPMRSRPSATTRPASELSATSSADTTAANAATSSATGTRAMSCLWTRTQTSTPRLRSLAPATTASRSSRPPMVAAAASLLALPRRTHRTRCPRPQSRRPPASSPRRPRAPRSLPVCRETGTGAPSERGPDQHQHLDRRRGLSLKLPLISTAHKPPKLGREAI